MPKARVVKLYVLCEKIDGAWNPKLTSENNIIGSIDLVQIYKVLGSHQILYPESEFKVRISQLIFHEV